VSPFTFAVLSFAAYRASRALALDTITEPVRDWLDIWSSGRALPRKLYELMSCGWCNGFWLAGVTYAVYLTVTGSWENGPDGLVALVLFHLIMWWAVAGAQSMLIAIDSFLIREAPPT
jgi:hypothetical protein